MKTLIIYDSQFGNTENIAKTIGKGISSCKVLKVDKVKLEYLKGINLLIIGSPTQRGRAKQSLQIFLKQIPKDALRDTKVAAFDTRLLKKDLNFLLQLLIKTIGYAAPKIAGILESKGGILIAPPEGFIVKARVGPLVEGESERAKAWVKQIINRAY